MNFKKIIDPLLGAKLKLTLPKRVKRYKDDDVTCSLL